MKQKTEIDEITDALEALYGDAVVSVNLSAHQAAADRLCDRIYKSVRHGRLRFVDAQSMVTVAKLSFIWIPVARFGATCYGTKCKNRRIKKGDGMYFAKADALGNREAINLCAPCGDAVLEREGQRLW